MTAAAIVVLMVVWAARRGLRPAIRVLGGLLLSSAATYAAISAQPRLALLAAAATAGWGATVLISSARLQRRLGSALPSLDLLPALGGLMAGGSLAAWPTAPSNNVTVGAVGWVVAGAGVGLVLTGVDLDRGVYTPACVGSLPLTTRPVPATALVSMDVVGSAAALLVTFTRLLGGGERFALIGSMAVAVAVAGFLVTITRVVSYWLGRYLGAGATKLTGGMAWMGTGLAACSAAATNAHDTVVAGQGWLGMGFGLCTAVVMLACSGASLRRIGVTYRRES